MAQRLDAAYDSVVASGATRVAAAADAGAHLIVLEKSEKAPPRAPACPGVAFIAGRYPTVAHSP